MIKNRNLILSVLSAAFIFTGCFAEPTADNALSEMKISESMELEYAQQFCVDTYENGCSLVTVGSEDRFLIVPENTTVPDGISEDITVIQQPVEKIYLSASSAMDLFDGIGGLDSVFATSTKQKEWTLPAVTERMDAGTLMYAGKYSAPDYELIISNGCDLAIESTMIYHNPEVKEQLEAQEISVLVERSSYETHPLGRMEWIKLYGLILGRQEQAEAFFYEKSKLLDNILSDTPTGKTAAFFYISSNGSVNVRKPGDYISKMIELAGGSYLPTAEQLDVEDNALSTMNMQFEAFYAAAKDADILIYNSTVGGGIASVDELIMKNELFKDFKAVQNDNVWCTEQNMYQQTSAAADMTEELHMMFSGKDSGEYEFIYKLK